MSKGNRDMIALASLKLTVDIVMSLASWYTFSAKADKSEHKLLIE